ncbi:helix-turn-helix domain-containing protein [Flavobacterium sp. NRK F10]|uniref:helix-turn-helix domain-containing protein n=1 Tax=Flavobacterium sp. NRK F10 TaxID=2954931 RepID=UPI0020911137|nr:helix-turn-helix domain-containing protein [Flavobacterium sp. NRK F10]MCO6173420.1 helix-turn-helix domain-containing protein [Flavobacterium sp. NRK F10]
MPDTATHNDTQTAKTSIAVLPFVNMSNDIENEYFSDGITEEIINALTKINGLKVIARTSSFALKGKNIDVREIGKQLGVAIILEGSVRKSVNKVRITAQLIDTVDGTHFWSKNFDSQLNDIFELQDEVSLLIANEIRNNFGYFEIQEHLVKNSTTNVDAYELFLKGRSLQLQWTPESLKKAITYYDKAISKDINYAKAYYANLQCYGLLVTWGYMPQEEGMEKAITNFLKAKALDTQLPEYPLSFVGRSFWGEWDFKSAYHYINEVLAINPNHIDGLEAMAELFLAHGFFKEALVYADKLLEVDPLSANNHYTYANIHYYKGDFETALHHISRAINLRPDFDLAYHKKALCLISLNRKEELTNTFKNNALWEKIHLLFDCVNSGRNELPQDVLANFTDKPLERNQITLFELFILANTRYTALAFDILRSYIDQKRGQILNYKFEPLLKPLQTNKEFFTLNVSNLSYDDITLPVSGKETSKVILNEQEQSQLKEELLSYFDHDKPFLDPQLSLNTVAEALHTSPNKLSYLINEVMGMNFNEFVNKKRLTHFKSIALLPENENITLLGLAYDSGFNSKSVFNNFFKKNEKTTPSSWLKANKR